MMKSFLNVLIAVLPIFASAEESKEFRPTNLFQVNVCIGQYSSRCPKSIDFHIPCGTSIQEAVAKICTLQMPDGTTVPMASNYFESASSRGNRCDYHSYIVFFGR